MPDERLRSAFDLLLRAHGFADDVGCDLWDFAVEADCFRRLGLTTSDLRWLACKGFVEHAREVRSLEIDGRSFRPCGRLAFPKHTCLVLTDKGVEYAHSLSRHFARLPEFGPGIANSDGKGVTNSSEDSAPPRIVPIWDGDFRELRFQDLIVKCFKLPSQNQEALIMAFDEEGWPRRIDDPLPQSTDGDPKQRLRETIRGLNRNQKNRLLVFKGDGTGEGVLWQALEEGTSR